MVEYCPHCHQPIDRAVPIELDGWRLWPGAAELRGKALNLSPAEASVLFTLAQARGDVVPGKTIGKQYSDVESIITLRVIITRLRKKLGRNCPVFTVHGLGYRWQTGAGDLKGRRSRNGAGTATVAAPARDPATASMEN